MDTASVQTFSLMPCANYSFYKIFCNDPTIQQCYIGKTTNFSARCANHKTNCKNLNTLKLYAFMRDNGNWENWTISVIHKSYCPFDTAGLIEYALIKQHNANLNIQLPTVHKKKDYNRMKCAEHYKITRDCDCGWSGSKMDWSHHIKSVKHKKFLIDLFENNMPPCEDDKTTGTQTNFNGVIAHVYGVQVVYDGI